MGRELRRKQAKREGKSLKVEKIDESNSLTKYLKIIIGLIIVITLVYLLSATFITKEINWSNILKKDTANNETANVKNSILASAIFKQSEEEYYVYFYDFNDEDSNISSIIESKLSDSKVYYVDTSSALNSKYVSDTSNKNDQKLEDLKVISPTVIKISGDAIVQYYEKNEKINNLK